MSRIYTNRMKEIHEKITPYIQGVDPIKWKDNTPENIKKMYDELIKIHQEQYELEKSLIFPS